MSLRGITLALVVSLLLVPALARAQQAIDPGRAATTTSSFSKSVDVPPDHVSVPPDLSVTLIDVDLVRHPVRGVVIVPEPRLPDAPDPFESDTHRGPPDV